MNDQPNATHNDQLTAADAAALDALIDAGLNLSLVPDAVRPRAQHIGAIMGLLDTLPVVFSTTLTDVTMARLLRLDTHAEESDAVLCADDIEALDALFAAEFRVSRVAASLRPRAEKIDSLARLVAETPVQTASTDIADRTMKLIAASKRRERDESTPIRGGFRMADLVSVAAVLVMGVAVLWPLLSTVRTYNQKSDCASNFASIGSAMGQYAGDFRDSLPMATASFGGSWLNVGSTPDQSNSANLYTLARSGYTRLNDLACAGNPLAARGEMPAESTDWHSLPEVSYSYYIMFGKSRPTAINSPGTIILADKSPVVLRVYNNEQVAGPPRPLENSPNHQGRGQLALRADGTAVWLSSPKDGRDNIWLTNAQQHIWETQVEPILPEIRRMAPKGTKEFNVSVLGVNLMLGNELPDSDTDSFLGP